MTSNLSTESAVTTGGLVPIPDQAICRPVELIIDMSSDLLWRYLIMIYVYVTVHYMYVCSFLCSITTHRFPWEKCACTLCTLNHETPTCLDPFLQRHNKLTSIITNNVSSSPIVSFRPKLLVWIFEIHFISWIHWTFTSNHDEHGTIISNMYCWCSIAW